MKPAQHGLPSGFFTLDMLGSADKTIRNISLYSPEILEFGHIDLFSAKNSMTDVWPHVLEWIEGHPCRELPENSEQITANR